MGTFSDAMIKETKNIFRFFVLFCKFTFNFENFQQKKTLIADAFLNLPTTTDVVRYLSKKSSVTGPFNK